MQASRLVVLAFTVVALAACSSDHNAFDPPKPLDKMSKEELCDYYKFYLTDPNLSAQTRQVATSKARQKGCAG